jgi:hypothetical protein
MLSVMFAIEVVFGFYSRSHCQCRGPNDACKEQNVGQLLGTKWTGAANGVVITFMERPSASLPHEWQRRS